ncbi:MAG TPA: transglutaminase domain-containing protein, partial [Candidatus Xenobia bacterium]
ITYPYRDKGTYLKAVAITDYLRNHYTYSTTTPPPPPGTDVTDQFLFQTRAGDCEQFATAMAVLCRAQGIPARLVVGYLPGSFNPFSGVYEVHASEAHAWVEIGLPIYGWLSMDPTPGWTVLPGAGHTRSHWVLGALLDYLATNVKVPAGVRRAIVGLQKGLRSTHILQDALVLAGCLFLLWAGSKAPRLRGRGRVARPPPAPVPDYQNVLEEYQHMLSLLGRHGYNKRPGQTPSEFAAQVRLATVARMTRSFEQYRYGPDSKASADALAALRDDLRSLRESLERTA